PPYPSRFETSDWGPVVTGLLTQRGLFTRDFESFGRILRGPVVNVGVTFGPQTFSLERESGPVSGDQLENPYWLRDTTKPQGLSLSGFSVNYMDADIPR
ncbi:hypothetical protein ACFL6M_07795, partial [Candidatus Eisenbacteria bacterium]